MNKYVPYGNLTGGKLMLAAFVLALANFMVVLDMTIANVSVPHITGSLAVPARKAPGSLRLMQSQKRSVYL
jgi:hypothetical protein